MSTSTVSQTLYEIREGLTHDGSPFIEGVVDGQGVVLALRLSQPVEPQWVLTVYQEVASAAGTAHPIGTRIFDEDQARHWVELLTALYAKVTEQPVDIMLDPSQQPFVGDLR